MTVDTDDDYTNLIGQIVLYRADSNGDYALRKAPNSHFNGTAGDTAAAAKSSLTGAPVSGDITTTNGVAIGGATNFVMKNSNARIDVNGSTHVFANSETVFIVAETTATNETTYSAYVGIVNAPTILSDDPTTGSTETDRVEMFYYVRGNNILAFAFIDATGAYKTSGKQDVVFLAGDEGMTGRVFDSDGTEYYLYNAVVGGDITTVRVATGATNFANVGDQNANYVLQDPQYNSKGVITGFNGTLSGYTVYNQYNGDLGGQGIWKLSGAYTIGLGGSKASASTRLTVASDAKMFYIDTDGVITKIADVSSIVSDTNDKVIALLDNSSGDVAYLFIQEVDSNSSDNATDNTPGNVTSLAYSAGTATIHADKDGVYTLRVEILAANGSYTTAASYNVTVTGGVGTQAIGSLGAGVSGRLVCGAKTVIF